jgi:membrane-associated phospholipid phosphatase
VLFVLFLWSRIRRPWRYLLALYPLFMMFTLAYGGDHYVADGISGALCAWLVHWSAGRFERRRARRRAVDRLAVEDPAVEMATEPG